SPIRLCSGPTIAASTCARSTSTGGSFARLSTSSPLIGVPSRTPPRIARMRVSRAASASVFATATGSPPLSRNAIAVGPSSSASSASAPAASAARRVSVFFTTWKRAPCSSSRPRSVSMSVIDTLRGRLLEHGARFQVVKNTLTRRAAEAAGADALLALLEGPTAIAFLESGGDPVAVAKTLADAARDTRILAIRGGVLEGTPMSGEEVESLAKLPPVDVLRAQVLAAIVGPLQSLIGL